jgi:hypothetical protein
MRMLKIPKPIEQTKRLFVYIVAAISQQYNP